MPDINDSALIARLVPARKAGKLDWESTATADQFTASYGGRWTLTVDRTQNEGQISVDYYFKITNSQGEEVLRIWDRPDNVLTQRFEKTRRRALKVDEALGGLLKEIGELDGPEISDEDIPF